MKQKTTSTTVLKLGWIAFFLILAAITLILSSFTARKATGDFWQMLGLSQQDGQEKIKSSFMNGYLYYYGARNLRHIAVNDREAVAKDLLNYTRSYISSPAFNTAYQSQRTSAKPAEPAPRTLRSIAAIQKEELAKAEQSVRDMEKNIKDFPQYAKSWEPVLAQLKKNVKDYHDPSHTLFASIAQGEKMQQDYERDRYERDLKNWANNYPENVQEFIATKLQKMLDRTAGIDYTAELVEKYGKKRFVNPDYEAKTPEWKLGYRAGKEVTETARSFARKWLQELQPGK